MSTAIRASLRASIASHEGLGLKPYRCTKGKLTIGYGRNIEDNGISRSEAAFLLENDIDRVLEEARSFSWFAGLDPVRQLVVCEMLFNLGMDRFLGFKRMIAALAMGNYATAAAEMLDSDWRSQVKGRALTLAEQMRTGKSALEGKQHEQR